MSSIETPLADEDSLAEGGTGLGIAVDKALFADRSGVPYIGPKDVPPPDGLDTFMPEHPVLMPDSVRETLERQVEGLHGGIRVRMKKYPHVSAGFAEEALEAAAVAKEVAETTGRPRSTERELVEFEHRLMN